ncbi:LacI family DNA-binding transcriptional regulator [Aquibacillus koreensis]|uniref:LacI family DNA-binding transcriptional regulator n=1 Tax=Aquibacillus koreensis TaxID=279446 RepID=A0A9X4AK37_9BACI|nr:LacI family DNA-binding transcriptional regulator [Aquibacillus koreensis]MCT2537898.1 LacI family DNA-binding transcriptional regulator [Aquibacillus koreensis]MDC3422666.1 LacI family DNA-binding transcriptional regulator [Aquibacillus koreensis]
MATIQEVAKKAGVSVATVSRVLNKHTVVNAKTRAKVEKVIKELNYEPSMLGRNLRNSESKLLLVVIPSIANPFYTEIVDGIQETAISNGYHILLCETNSNPEREATYFGMIKNRMADGVICMDPAVNKQKLFELAEKYPIVQCSDYDKGSNIPYVTIDSELAAYHAVRHLIKIGHKRIAMINTDERILYARERRAGYERALKEFGIPLDEELIFHTMDIDFNDGQQAMRSLLEVKDVPTAAFAVSDVLAIGALKEINNNGLKVPNDIALIGFDKLSFSNMTYPALTTVAQPMFKMGSLAAAMLIQKIQGKKVENIVLEHELVLREST